MPRTKIKAGQWYETAQGIGKCVKAGGCHPWAALVVIMSPIPRGERWLSPREFIRETTPPPGQS